MDKVDFSAPLSEFGASLTDSDGDLYEHCEDCDEVVYCDLCNDFHCRLWLNYSAKYCEKAAPYNFPN